MTFAQNFLETVHQVGGKGHELRKVYRRIQERELFLLAYGKLYANQGALTPGVDPTDTVDSMSLSRIDDTIAILKNGDYVWQPVRKVEIPKKRGGNRPLGVPGWRDKLLQEVIRMVLDAYYEPQFSVYSHGFRPQRGCHTALRAIHRTWKGTKWFIEMDIARCFDSFDHELLLSIIGRHIKDNRFLKLLRGMLEAGYMTEWVYHKTYSGVPQGGIASPILSNIYLNELDKFVTEQLLPTYNRGQRKAKNPLYEALAKRMKQAQSQGDQEEYRRLFRQRQYTPSLDTHDESFRRLRYIRYADDGLLGFDGPKCEAIAIKTQLADFLATIKLRLSPEKTLITHAATERARFLGYDISVSWEDQRLAQRDKRRARNGQIRLSVPPSVIAEWKRNYSKHGRPTHRSSLVHCSDFEIVRIYGIAFQGLVNYYALAHDVSTKLYTLKFIIRQSLARTIAHKHNETVKWVYRRYRQHSDLGVDAIIVEVPNPKDPHTPYLAQFGHKPIETNRNAILNDTVAYFYPSKNELVRRLLADECELCGSTEQIRVHHVRKLADVKKRYYGRKDPPAWAIFMMSRRRKTVVVCHKCHRDIHSGNYDGVKVN